MGHYYFFFQVRHPLRVEYKLKYKKNIIQSYTTLYFIRLYYIVILG